MTPPQPRHHDTAPNADTDDRSDTDAQSTDCTTAAGNPVDARLNELLRSISRWNALFVGALTVVLAQEVAARLPLGDTATALALFPVSLALLYALLTAAAHLEGR
jgi:hypothetical protein